MHLCFAVKEDNLGNVHSQTEMHKKKKPVQYLVIFCSLVIYDQKQNKCTLCEQSQYVFVQ